MVAVHVSSIDLAPGGYNFKRRATPDVIAISNYSLGAENLDELRHGLLVGHLQPPTLAEPTLGRSTGTIGRTISGGRAQKAMDTFHSQGQLDYLTDLDALLTNLGPAQCLGWCY